jgi:hypothetical protein
MLDVSQQTVSSIESNIPSIQALIVDGPNFKIHNAWLVTPKTDILQKTRQTASLSQRHCRKPNRRKIR